MPILSHVRKDNKIKCEATYFCGLIENKYSAVFANYPCGNSSFFYNCLPAKDAKILCLFYYSPKTKLWKVSLYRAQKSNVNVSKIAKNYGGDGHAGAAGFNCSHRTLRKFLKI